MAQTTTCRCASGGPCNNSYCPQLGRNAAVEGRTPAQRNGIGALASTVTVSTSAPARSAA